jgi:uncharacterized repeat protein (TIGR02543 family)
VGDASFFFSGSGAPWYIAGTVGDTIYIEGSGSVQIASINQSTNTITLSSPMTWTSGKKVYHRAYSGNAPDLGAYEYQGGSTTYTLSVSATNGTVTKTPNQTSYTSGQTVTLQATPNAGYTFSGWSGDLTGTTNPATLVMNANKSVTANFTATTYTLTVNAPAAGRYVRMLGLQRGTSWGYSLYEFEVYGSGTGGTLAAGSVNLALGKPAVASSVEAGGLPASNATDGSLSESSRWSSLYSDNEWICVDLGSVCTVQRVVLPWETAYGRSYKLQVSNDAATWSEVYSTTTGAGGVDDITLSAPNGTVTKTPNQTSYTSGQTVTLQATPNAGYTFSGWSGALTGTANPATLVMDANKSVTANFTAVPTTYTLAISATNGTFYNTPNQNS